MSRYERLWHPRGVAVIGASNNPQSLGAKPIHYLVKHGYPGAIYPVNPRYEEVQGLSCYPTVSACPGPVDLALVMVAADRVPAAMQDCAAKGVPYAMVLSAGFAESGADGARLQAEMLAIARAAGIRVIGPNCIGLVSPPTPMVAGFSPFFARADFKPGNLGLVTQSGALGFGITSLALEGHLRLSRVINTGNESDLSSAEIVADFIEDDVTRAILVYNEGMHDAERWPALAEQALARQKPIIVMKTGRSDAGSRAAASHTAALSGDDKVWSAVFDQFGIIRADDVEDLLDLALGFSQPRLPRGNRVGVLTTSGGAGILAADACTEVGLAVPELTGKTRDELEKVIPSFGAAQNPVDVTAQVIADREVFRNCLRIMAADPGLDMLLCCFCVLQGEEADRIVEDLLTVAAETNKPFLVARTGAEHLAPAAARTLIEGGLPTYRTPARAARVAAALLRQHQAQERVAARGPRAAVSERTLPAGWPAAGEALTERAAKALLAAEGLPVTQERLAATADAAAAAAAAIGYPVVMKIESPDILHKSDVGGVELNLGDAAAVRAAFDRIMAAAKAHRPDARIAGVLVQEQVSGGVEVLVGVTPSPLGATITVGLGGVLVEVLKDASLRLAPVERAEARAMVDNLKGAPLLQGVRGRPPADIEALVDVIVRVAELAAAWPGAWELDLNPVLVLPAGQGVRIADALLVARSDDDAKGEPHA